MMDFSLLYKVGEHAPPCGSADLLLLRDTFEKICSDPVKVGIFTDTIDRPPELEENVRYRRGIIGDLSADPQLARRLKTVFARYDRMRDDWAETRAAASVDLAGGAAPEVCLEAAWSALRRMAAFPSALISFLSEISEITSGDRVASDGLKLLNSRCGELCRGELKTLAETAELFRFSSPDTHEIEVSAVFDPYVGGFTGMQVAGVRETEKKKRGIAALLQKRAKSVETSEGEAVETAKRLAASAAKDLCDLFASRIGAVYGEFYGISRELCFYECAVEYIACLQAKGVPFCYPLIGADGGTEISGLRDLRLIASGEDPVPSDLSLSGGTRGILIRGENGSGKTTFLRSVGTAYLLFRAGLPIPASEARMSVGGGVFCHFASAEEDLCAGDRAGRFEGEARAVSGIVDRLRPGSVFLMNETFQTTSYEDGTAAMRDLLAALGGSEVRYLLVTHLTGLFDPSPEGAACIEFDLHRHKYQYLNRERTSK